MSNRVRFVRFLLAILALAVPPLVPVEWPGLGGVAYAFHFAWDQGHDPFTPDPGDDDTDPDDDDCNNQGSPFDVATGNYVHTAQDFFIPALGPDLDITRTYNSRDMRSGSFGHGWTFTYDLQVTVATDGVTVTAICRDGSGRRERYTRNPDGSFIPPSDKPATLTENQDGTVIKRDKDGTTWTFDSTGLLSIISDRNQNILTIERDSTGFITAVIDATGRRTAFTKGPNGKIQSISDPSNRVFSYEYDADGNLVRYTDPLAHVTQYSYDAKHNLTSVVDPQGNTVQEITYDSQERLATYIENGETWTVTFFPDQKKTTKRDSAGNTWTLTYNDNGNVTSNTDPLGGVETQNYDANFYPAQVTDKNGNAAAFVYDSLGNVLKKTDPAGNETTYTYDPEFNQVTTIAETGRLTSFSYDAKGNLIEEKVTAGSKIRTWNYTYDSKGQLLAVDGPRTDVVDTTTYTYDAHGSPATTTNALGHVTRIAQYDLSGQPLQIVDPNGLITTLTYDAGARVISRAVGTEVTTYTYDGNGLIDTSTLPDGSVMRYKYDAFGRITEITDASGDSVRYSLDSKGNRVKEIVFDSQGLIKRIRRSTYDILNRLTEDIGAFGQMTKYAYDRNDNVLTVTDPLNHVTTKTYDSLNRVSGTVDANNGRVQYQYDPLGNLIRVTDPLGNNTDYSVDGLGNTEVTESPDAGTKSRTYDTVGNALTETDARGKTTSFEYDALARLTRTIYNDGTEETRLYDTGSNNLGRLTSITDPHGITRWTYDLHGRVTERRQELDGVILSLQYKYDAQGRLDQLTYPSGKVVSLAYDAAGRVNRVQVDGQTVLNQIAYEPHGPVASWAWGNGTNYKRGFDLDGRIIELPSGTAVQRLDYDAASRIIGLDGDVSKTYGYDSVDRLESFTSPSVTQTYSYDLNGNRLGLTQDAQAITYSYDPGGNRLLGRTQGSTQNYSYDPAGNLINDSIHAFTYDDQGRLTQVATGATGTAYRYNGLGQRVAKAIPGTAVTTRRFVYDEPGHLVGEYDNSGTPIKETVYLEEIPVVVLSGANSVHFLYPDHINTPRVAMDDQDTVVWRWESDPFGVGTPAEDPDGDGNLFSYNSRFPGQYFDSESGLHQNWHRDYDPAIGRYLQPDPTGLDDGPNVYAYAGSNPINYFDFEGEARSRCRRHVYLVLRGAVLATCKVPTRCESGDSCNILRFKIATKRLCIAAQEALSRACFPGDQTHKQRVEDERKGIKRCEDFKKTCPDCE